MLRGRGRGGGCPGAGSAGGAPYWLEYQVNLLSLRVSDPAVTRILRQKCTKIYRFQTKKLKKKFLGSELIIQT